MAMRYIFRDEPKLKEPKNHPGGPIKAILYDTKALRYHLLQAFHAEIVKSSIKGVIPPQVPNGVLYCETPFPISINLFHLAGNTRLIKPSDLDSPDGVVRAPLSVYFAGAAKNVKCPVECQHCYEGEDNLGPDSQRRPLEDEQINNLLVQFREAGVFNVRFTGPEVTLNPRFPEWVDRVRELGMSAAMSTSGFFNHIMRGKILRSGLQEAIFSLEGAEENQKKVRGLKVLDAYSRTIENLIAFSDAGIRTRINITVGRHNIKDLEFVVDLAAKYCKGGVSLIPLRALGLANNNLSDALLSTGDMFAVISKVMELRKKYPGLPIFTYHDILDDPTVIAPMYHPYHFQKSPCPAEANLYVTVTGLAVSCCQTMVLPNIDGKTFYFGEGDLTEQTLMEVWKHDPGLQRFRSIEVSKECQECEYYGTRCEGGCPAEYFSKVPQLQTGKGAILATEKDRLCLKGYKLLTLPEHND